MPLKFEFSIQELNAMQNNPWLTDREKQVFDLFYVRGWKIEDIAAELDISRRTVTTVLQKIRRKSIEILK